jgi:prolyl-tRNA synthetase
MKSAAVAEHAERLYRELQNGSIDVLYDDRTAISPGFKFKDADLLGMPLQVIVGEKNLANGKVEIKIRKSGERILVEADQVASKVRELLK